ncbi:putative glycerol-3-phosphate acyltransferase 2 [Bienertia sinuspersici]
MKQSYHHYSSLITKVVDDAQLLQNNTLVFNVEETLLKSFSMFPYFMLVAFEGGGPLRALVLLILYPFLCILVDETKLKIMVFICFFGIKKKSFKIGKNVLPKYFLENVGYESFQVVMKFARKVGVSNLPKDMVEGFVRDFLGVEEIVGREIKVIGGYYTGFLIENDRNQEKILTQMESDQLVGICGANENTIKSRPFTYSKDIYVVNENDKIEWSNLPREEYPKPLIFHDGRLTFMPKILDTLVMFIWLPFGIILSIIRVIVAAFLPNHISTPILAFLGVHYPYSTPKNTHNNNEDTSKGVIYVCNHRTVLDAVYVSRIFGTHLTTPSYSISKLSEFLCPMNTVALTRDRSKDSKIVYDVLSQGRSIVMCPEGTTCREPYLLRFSPLFAELTDDIIPVAIQVNVSMFYGNTASGTKAFDPFFFMMNPRPIYSVTFLDKVPSEWTCGSGGKTKFEVANYVQEKIGKILGYNCTGLTRKDKYMMLAGNDGLVK